MSGESGAYRPERLPWIVEQHDKLLDNLDRRTEDYPVVKAEVQGLREDFAAVKRALWAVAVGLVSLLVGVLFAAARFTGKG